MILLLSCGILFLFYAILVLYYWYAWKSIPVFDPGTNAAGTRVSVVIPARNEEDNIGQLLVALQNQSWPADLFEIIVVDDHSDDRTAEIVKTFPAVKIVSLPDDNINSYKKKAIETGIAHATGEWIISTDADCVPPVDWLKNLAAFVQEKKAELVAAPVVLKHNSSVLQLFQAMDFMILQAITGAVVHRKQLSMCNGANLAYSLKSFRVVNGFNGIDTIASGDDMLLMHKIWMQYPEGVQFLKSKDAIVTTQPQSTWRAFFNQRIRWASKAGRYEDKRFFPVLLLVYLFNLSFLALLIGGIACSCYWKWLLILWGAKTLAELPLFVSASRFFKLQSTIKWFFFFQPLHILYTIISGFLGQLGKYEWKGRRVR